MTNMIMTMDTRTRKVGRPVGSTTGQTKAKISFTVDKDLLEQISSMPNRSAFINAAVRAALHPSAHQAEPNK